jgi:SagB-type dehydrogenase family enzyme
MAIILLAPMSGCAQDNPIKLPEPQKTGGMPLMEALSKRKTSRAYSAKELDLQTLSNMLWAAFGINREADELRTAPSAVNWQEIDIYVCLQKGVYLYNAKLNQLDFYMKGDIREATGKQPFVKDAPVNLVFVADYTRMGDRTEDVKKWYAAADVGFISQNVYLFCASEGMATVVRGMVDKEELKKLMNLRPDQHVVFAQTVGYPAE